MKIILKLTPEPKAILLSSFVVMEGEKL